MGTIQIKKIVRKVIVGKKNEQRQQVTVPPKKEAVLLDGGTASWCVMVTTCQSSPSCPYSSSPCTTQMRSSGEKSP